MMMMMTTTMNALRWLKVECGIVHDECDEMYDAV